MYCHTTIKKKKRTKPAVSAALLIKSMLDQEGLWLSGKEEAASLQALAMLQAPEVLTAGEVCGPCRDPELSLRAAGLVTTPLICPGKNPAHIVPSPVKLFPHEPSESLTHPPRTC
jgi:hypothetical protein